MSDLQSICATFIIAVLIICVTIGSSYQYYVDHKMPLEKTNNLIKGEVK